MAVRVPAEVLAGLEEVRRSGETNMFDRPAVQVLANRNGAFSTVIWIEENKDLYARGIFEGFEPVDATEEGGG